MKSHIRWNHVYFIGIGGIGMSAVARWFRVNGYSVAGYDRTPTTLTRSLEDEGMQITFDEEVSSIPDGFADKSDTLVVYTPAIPAGHPQLNFFRREGFELKKRSEILGLLTREMKTVGVAGTHGKTTTSSMIAHILHASGVNCTAFLGGITNNYQSNFLLNRPAEDLSEVVCVVEADEFDRSFLTLFPEIAVVTSTDADHLDIYGAHASLLASFQAYVDQVKPGGVLLMKKGLSLKSSGQVWEYGLREGAFKAGKVRVQGARFAFDIHYPDGVIQDVALQMPGYHNVENAVAAAAVSLTLGVPPGRIREALNSYKGVRRRFEYVLEGERVLIDDYAHHPTEITAFLSSVRALYPGRKITAVFQPHLFTRTRDFADGFAQSLALADRLYLLDIYPARELPIEGISSELLLEKVALADKHLVSKEELKELIREETPDILVTIGAGDIDKLVAPLKEILQNSLFYNT